MSRHRREPEVPPAFYHSFTIRQPIAARCGGHFDLMRFAIVAHRAGETNIGLITRRWRFFEPLLLTPREALATLAPGDAALGRLDIRDELDGIEDGLWALSELSAAGVRVLNPPAALISALLAGRGSVRM